MHVTIGVPFFFRGSSREDLSSTFGSSNGSGAAGVFLSSYHQELNISLET